MKKILSIFLFTLVLSQMIAGQVSDYTGRLDEKYGAQLTKIAVEDFTTTGNRQLTVRDSVTLIRLAEIIRNDLSFSPFYEIIELDSLYLRVYGLDHMPLLGWQRLGAEYVVKGEGEFEKDYINFKYSIYSTASGLEFGRGKFKSIASNYRRMAHQIANEIIYYLTGEQGIFDTRLAFISTRTGNKELFLCDFDGANVYQLTNNRSINLSPAFEPEGRKILFTSYMHDDPQLYQYDVISGDIDQLAAYPGINSSARVSPDGKLIICSLSRDGNAELYLLDRSGRIKRRLTYTAALESAPCWSPAGNAIAYSSDRTGTPQIYIMDKDGSNVRRLTYQGSYNDSPDWSPKGDKIVFAGRVNGLFQICTIDITGEDFQILTSRGSNENPHWSPDGNHIVFSSNRGGSHEIYVMDLFGNKVKRLTSGDGNTNPTWSSYRR